MKVTISPLSGKQFDLEIAEDVKVGDLKKQIAQHEKILPKQIRVFDSSNKIAKNSQVIKDLGYSDGSTISIITIEDDGKKKDEKNAPPNYIKIFNNFVKHIQDKSGGEETECEIISFIEKPKVQEMLENFSCDPQFFRDAIEQNKILQENRPLEDCIINTFEQLGASCAPKPAPITVDEICKLFGIQNVEQTKARINIDPELARLFDEIKDDLILAGGMNTFTKKQETGSNINLEQIFAPLLRQFNSMGFYDTKENLRAIEEGGGDFEAGIQWLLDQQMKKL